ncbi:MAG: hypothetical protein HC765_03855 [Brachymonas sp.]|nr:hypothetical protein [Brachymonas sp.]
MNDDGSSRIFDGGFAWKPTQLIEGYSWDFKDTGTFVPAKGDKSTWQRYGKFKVVRKESVRVPAGEFEAWRIEFNGYGGNNRWQETVWYVPALRNFVATEVEVRRSSGQIERFERHELTSYSVRGADEALAKR